MTVYADTSFIVSLYVTDTHSGESRERVVTSPQVWFTPLHRVEWEHAMAQQVFHRKMSATEVREMDRQLESDRAAGLWVEVAMPDMVFDTCADLARRHGARLGVRTLDSLHVALALRLGAERFWTFDDRQAKLAKAEGLKTS